MRCDMLQQARQQRQIRAQRVVSRGCTAIERRVCLLAVVPLLRRDVDGRLVEAARQRLGVLYLGVTTRYPAKER